MDGELEETTIKYCELQEKVLAKEEVLRELQAGTFGTDENDFVEIQLPSEETIEPRQESVAFPFSEPIPEEVIEAIAEVLNEDLKNSKVALTQEVLNRRDRRRWYR